MVSISSRYCRTCQRKTAAVWSGANHILHLLLTLFTAGFWFPLWILSAMTGSWRCQTCGSRTSAGTIGQMAGGFAVMVVLLIAAVAWFGSRSGAPGPTKDPSPQASASPAAQSERRGAAPARDAAIASVPSAPAEAPDVAAPVPVPAAVSAPAAPADPEAAARKRFGGVLRNGRDLANAHVFGGAEKAFRRVIDGAPGTAVAADAQKELDALPAH